MISIKLFLDKRRLKKDNTYSLNFQICHNRKTTTRYSGININDSDWDIENKLIRKTHPSYKTLNLRLKKDLADLHSRLILSDDTTIKEFLNPKKVQPLQPIKEKLTVYLFVQELIDDLKSHNKIGNAWVYESSINALKLFHPEQQLYFETIDYMFLNSYHRYLLQKQLKPNSIFLYLRTLRAFYNKAIKIRLVERVNYPFNDFKLSAEKTRKRAIDQSMLMKIIALDITPDSMEWHARNFFLFSFCMIGISIIDLALLKPCNIVNGRLLYRRRKTGKLYDIKIVPETFYIINQYLHSGNKYLFPIANAQAKDETQLIKGIKYKTKVFNKYLSKISNAIGLEPKITTYSSRHTWATIAKKSGFSIEIIAEALGHEHGNPTTNIYLDKYDVEVIDAANSRIINSVYLGK